MERVNYLESGDLDFVKLSALDDEIASIKAGLDRLNSYRNELFPKEA